MDAMKAAGLKTAVALARAALLEAGEDLGADLPVQALPVQRLDRDESYVLVRLGRQDGPGWIAAVDPLKKDVMTWAHTSGASTVPRRDTATQGVGDSDLVWQPCLQSMSPLYPVLRVFTRDGEIFVDLSGAVTTTLTQAHA